MARAPTPEQKAKEAAVLYTALADVANVALQFVFAAFTRSLSLLSEAIRGALMLAIEFYAYFVLRAVHRDRLGKFRFGIGQLEQMCNLAIGAGLVLSGLWVAHQVVQLLVLEKPAATPLGLATAAAINSINMVINSLGWFAMFSASRSDDSAIYSAQLRARTVKLLSCFVVQTTMTIAALAKDPLISACLDGLGATFVGALMVAIGSKMVWGALPDLLDRAVPEELEATIETILNEARVVSADIAGRRTRRAGSFPHIELTLSTTGSLRVGDFLHRVRGLYGHLRPHAPDADIAIAVHASVPISGGSKRVEAEA
jgi:divalent metal cation (Fe/Co/Zn/Cd) transporter